ncbi:hypothetical protein [Rhizobium sp. PL01]|uniref:hypothetical protein n=1 Tax=Rhizobium sp. PL01 TaxID=3085631 RepID=UPI002981D4A7|nr:hypothetical protein [Rhizobium sp. PL01]MDW5315522.1 hypothetical protein [Rhizobium sp. PL01]
MVAHVVAHIGRTHGALRLGFRPNDNQTRNGSHSGIQDFTIEGDRQPGGSGCVGEDNRVQHPTAHVPVDLMRQHHPPERIQCKAHFEREADFEDICYLAKLKNQTFSLVRDLVGV